VLALRKEVLGEKHPDTITAMASPHINLVAARPVRQGRTAQVEVLALRKEVLGEKHPDTITAMASLASTGGSKAGQTRPNGLRSKCSRCGRRCL